MYEDELIPLFEKCGKIWDLRLMMDPMSGSNRGYAFITFTNREAAQQAVREVCHIYFFKFLLLLCSLLMMYIYLFFIFFPSYTAMDNLKIFIFLFLTFLSMLQNYYCYRNNAPSK